MTHTIKAGDRFRATAPNGDTFEGTAAYVDEDRVESEFNFFLVSDYDFESLTPPLATKVGALYGPVEMYNSTHFLVRIEAGTYHPWCANHPHKEWLTDEQAAELVRERGWVRRDEFGA